MNYDGTQICAMSDRETASDVTCRWPFVDPTWNIAGTFAGFSDLDIKGAFELAWKQWADVCGIRARYVASNPNVLIRVGPIDGSGKTLAWSKLPCGGVGRGTMLDQLYDSGEAWVIGENPPANKVDLVRVACHEIGHVIGISHIGSGNLMAPTYSSTIRKPQAGDIAEAAARYPVVGTPPPIDPCKCPVPAIVRAFGLPEENTVSILRAWDVIVANLNEGLRAINEH